MRKRLPSLFSLQVFEVAARHGKFSLAATELNLTQSAISRQIKQLELWCDETLFARHGPRIELTAAGQDLLQRLGAPLNALHAAVYGDTEQLHLHISTLVSIAHSFLVPRLREFQSAHPELQLSVQTDYAAASFPPQLAMVAIRYTRRPPPDLQAELLYSDKLVAVAQPAFAAEIGQNPTRWPRDRILRHAALDWSHWYEGQNFDTGFDAVGMEFNDASVLLDAAEQGLGISLARLSVAAEKIRSGKLCLASPLQIEAPSRHYLLYRPDCANFAAVRHFRDWVMQQATDFSRDMDALSAELAA